MFYVAGGKVYGTRYDEALKGYPEFKVTVDHKIVATGKAVAEKPKGRQVCEDYEVFAQIKAKAEEPVKQTSKAKAL